MKMMVLAAAVVLSGCTSAQVAYTFGTGQSPQRLQELAAQRDQQRYEQDRAMERAEYYRTRCTRNHCKSDEDLAPVRYSCADPSLSESRRLACNLPGMTVTTDGTGRVIELGVE
jgi:hypothetical protein